MPSDNFRSRPDTQAAAAAMAALVASEHLAAMHEALRDYAVRWLGGSATDEALVLVQLAMQIKRAFYGNGGSLT